MIDGDRRARFVHGAANTPSGIGRRLPASPMAHQGQPEVADVLTGDLVGGGGSASPSSCAVAIGQSPFGDVRSIAPVTGL